MWKYAVTSVNTSISGGMIVAVIFSTARIPGYISDKQYPPVTQFQNT